MSAKALIKKFNALGTNSGRSSGGSGKIQQVNPSTPGKIISISHSSEIADGESFLNTEPITAKTQAEDENIEVTDIGDYPLYKTTDNSTPTEVEHETLQTSSLVKCASLDEDIVGENEFSSFDINVAERRLLTIQHEFSIISRTETPQRNSSSSWQINSVDIASAGLSDEGVVVNPSGDGDVVKNCSPE